MGKIWEERILNKYVYELNIYKLHRKIETDKMVDFTFTSWEKKV